MDLMTDGADFRPYPVLTRGSNFLAVVALSGLAASLAVAADCAMI